jgi:putative peptidoglycan lipid II flippase
MEGLHIVLALTNAVGAIANSWLLYRGLRQQGVMQLQAGWGALLLRMMVANVVMGIGLYLLAGNTELWLEMSTWTRIWRLTACVVGGGSAYFAALWLSGGRVGHFKLHAP